MPPALSNRSLEWIWSGDLYEDEDLALIWTGDLDFVPAEKMAALPSDRLKLKSLLEEYTASKDTTYMDDVLMQGRSLEDLEKAVKARVLLLDQIKTPIVEKSPDDSAQWIEQI